MVLGVRIRAECLASFVAELASARPRRRSGMMQGAETEVEWKTLVVRTPIRFQRSGGRERIVAGRQRARPANRSWPDSPW